MPSRASFADGRRRAAAAGLALALAALGLSPGGAQAAPLPRQALLILEKDNHAVAVVDLATRAVVARIPAGEDPHELVVSPDARRAYISNYGGPGSSQHTLSVVDLAAGKAMPPIELGALRSAHGLDFAQGKVWFTAETAKAIGRYDPVAGKLDWTLGLGFGRTHMIKVASPTRIYTANVMSGSIAIIDQVLSPSRPQDPPFVDYQITELKTGPGAEGFAVAPDGKSLWVVNGKGGTVSIIDTEAKRVAETLKMPWTYGNRLRFTPDGRRVLVSSEELLVIDVASHAMRSVKVGAAATGVLVAPDSRTAYVAVSGENKVAIVDLETLAVTGTIATGGNPDGMALVGP